MNALSKKGAWSFRWISSDEGVDECRLNDVKESEDRRLKRVDWSLLRTGSVNVDPSNS
jgi:hypothetical protein